MDDTVKDFFGIFNTIELMQIKVLKGLQDCILTYGHNKTSTVGKFASVYICMGLEMLEPASKLHFSLVLSQRCGFILIFVLHQVCKLGCCTKDD